MRSPSLGSGLRSSIAAIAVTIAAEGGFVDGLGAQRMCRGV